MFLASAARETTHCDHFNKHGYALEFKLLSLKCFNYAFPIYICTLKSINTEISILGGCELRKDMLPNHKIHWEHSYINLLRYLNWKDGGPHTIN